MLGSPKQSDVKHNCMNCGLYSVCGDPSKSYRYLCSKWIGFQEVSWSEDNAVSAPRKAAKPLRSNPSYAADRKIDELIAMAASEKNPIAAAKAEKSIISMVQKALSNDMISVPDVLVDDSDMRLADNVWDWITSPDMADIETKLFARQFQILVQFLAEYCPKCSDKNYFSKNIKVDDGPGVFLDRTQLLHKGVCPKCKATKSDMVRRGDLNDYWSLVAIIGQRSGKSMITSFAETYAIHRLLRATTSPQRSFGMSNVTLLVGTYVAMTFAQVKISIFSTIRSTVSNSPWFNAYHEILRDVEERKGIKLHSINELSIAYRHRMLAFGVASSNKASLRGASRVSVIIDELGHWKHGAKSADLERANGPEVFSSLTNSLATASGGYTTARNAGANNLPKPYAASISSPASINDAAMTLFRDGEGSRDTYTIKLPTWEVNPLLPESSEFLTAKKRQSLTNYMRDYGASPPFSESAWIEKVGDVEPMFEPGRPNIIKMTQRTIFTTTQQKRTGAEASIVSRANYMPMRVMTLDVGRTNNAFAFMIGHRDSDAGHIVVDGLGEIQPSREAPVSNSYVYEHALLPMARDAGVKITVSDKYQHTTLLDMMEQDAGCAPYDRSLTYDNFIAAKSDFYDRAFILPGLEMPMTDIFARHSNYPDSFRGKPASHLMYQIMTVRDYASTKKVEKGAGATDDLFRCLILLHWALNNNAILDILANCDQQVEEDAAEPQSSFMGMTRSGGAGGIASNRFGSVGGRAPALSGPVTKVVNRVGESPSPLGYMGSSKK